MSTNIDGTFGLADDIADDRGREKLPNFVLNRRDGFVSEFVLPGLIFVHPEGLDDRVFQIGNYFLAIVLVHQHAGNPEKRRAGRVKQSQDAII